MPILFKSPSRRRLATLTMILFATLTGCEESAGSVGPDPIDGVPGAVPSQLVGRWLHGLVSLSGYADAYSGQWLDNAYGTSVLFEFTADGHYRQSILIKTSAYTCRTQLFIYNEGTAVVANGTIKTYPTSGTLKSRDSCNAQFNYDRPDDIAKKQGQSYTWRFGPNATSPDDTKTYLILGLGAENTPAYFREAQ